MKTVLVVAADEGLRARLLRRLRGYSVFVAGTDADATKTLQMVNIDVVVRQSTGAAGDVEAFVATARELCPLALTIAIRQNGDDPDAADYVLPAEFTERDLEGVLRYAEEKQRLQREIVALKEQRTLPPASMGAAEESGWSGDELARVLKEFSRVFAAGFDLPRALEIFLNAIQELIRPTRLALLLPDGGDQEFRVSAQRGLSPQIVGAVRLSGTRGLARWLASQGRPARLGELSDPEIVRELKLLQGVVAVPLLAHGELVAILIIGQPIFGASYGRRETETVFDLAMHLATAIRDFALHHQLAREKEFSERILAHMSSGVVTIGRDHRVGTMNRRAEEILSIPAEAAIGEDLRVLPSPLGDMLFDTLRSGRTVARTEIQLALRGLWLEVSTYPVRGDEPTPLGAVIVFEDLTAQKELLAQKRQAEQLQLLTRVVARIADEIKNPLVSINTFVELIGERYDDPDFRKHFSSVVGRDVRRLIQVFEKLAGLVTEGELHFSTVDVHAVVEDVKTSIELGDDAGQQAQLEVHGDSTARMVRVDVAQLRKALSYLVRYLSYNTATEPARVQVSIGRHEEGNGEAVRVLVTSRTASVSPEKLQRLFDPVQMVQESLIDVGPAVSQRLIEALGGRLQLRHGRHELGFMVTLPTAPV